jgi:hypothetical protein
VIYFNRLSAGEIWFLVLYAKAEAENIPAHVLRRIKEESRMAKAAKTSKLADSGEELGNSFCNRSAR